MAGVGAKSEAIARRQRVELPMRKSSASFCGSWDAIEIPEVLLPIWHKLEPTPSLEAFLQLALLRCSLAVHMKGASTIINSVRAARVFHGDDVLAANIAVRDRKVGTLSDRIADRVWDTRDARSAAQLIWAARIALEIGNSERTIELVELAVQRAPDDPDILLSAYSTTFDLGLEDKRDDIHGWFEKAGSYRAMRGRFSASRCKI